jgi:Protein of unknown function (DUF3347)
MKKTLFTIAVATLISIPSLTHAADNHTLMQPVKSVYDHYLKIQTDLANDSLKGVPEEADAIVKAVQGDSMKMLPETIAKEAEALSKASDLKSARAAFKPLSDSLIKYLADHHAKNAYVEVYCPMADASWLQMNKNVNNPYLGKAMATCGEVKN